MIRTACTPSYGVFVVLLQLTLYAHAQQDTAVMSQRISDVVVTGQYGESSVRQSAYKIRVIDSRRMQAQGAFNLRDVLTNELNVRISQDPVLGSSMSLQGIGGQNIKILVDGVPVIGRENGNVDLTQINLANIARIELVEGPMSVNFGTDALGGVINLISKKPSGARFGAGANAYYESNGQYNAGANFSVGNKGWTLSAGGARNFFDGYSSTPGSRLKQWKPREQYMADASLSKTFTKGSLRWSNQWFDEKVTSRDSGVITPYFAYGLDKYFYTQRITSSLFFDYKLTHDRQVNIVAGWSGYRRVGKAVRKDLVTLEEKLIPDAEQQDTNDTQLWMSRGTFSKNEKGKTFNYQGGYEVNRESMEGSKISEGYRQMSDYSLFGSAEIRVKRLLVRPGLRYTYHTIFTAPLIPSLHIRYDLNSRLVFRASYGRGFRAPSLKELYLRFVDPSHNVQGNPNLVAETGDNYQVSFQYEYIGDEKGIRLEPYAFYNHVKNMIDLARLGTSTVEARYINVNEVRSTGVNMNAEYFTPRYTLNAGYGYSGKSSSLMNRTSGNDFFFSHEVRANATYRFIKAGLSLSAFYKYNGKLQSYVYDLAADKVTVGYIDPYSLLDVSATRELFSKSLSITGGVKNILNITNIAASVSAGPHSSGGSTMPAAMGRTFFVGVRYFFEKGK